jgi:DNA-binding HxlR family transcriptional regulator/putative sterol carrier protein
MKRYNQFCPVAKAAEIFCERWTPLILRDLGLGSTRFSELQRGVPLASPTLLTQRLRELEAEGVIMRRRSPDGRSWTYHLTRAGEELIPIVTALGVWGQRWSRRTLRKDEQDVMLLLWELEQFAHPECLGKERTIIEFEFTDQPQHKRRWWFLNDGGHCELCVKPPDREAQLYVTVSLPDMIRIWRGDISVASAIACGRMKLHGTTRVRKAFRAWLGICPLAHVKSQRRDSREPGERGAGRAEVRSSVA